MLKLVPNDPERLWTRYIGVLTVLLCLVTAGHSVYRFALFRAAQDTLTIEVLNKQQHLSRQIMLWSGHLAHDHSNENLHRDVQNALADFRAGMVDLRDRAQTDDVLANLVRFQSPDGLNASSTRFVEAITELVKISDDHNDDEHEMIAHGAEASVIEQTLRRNLEDAITSVTRAAEQRDTQLQNMQLIAFIVSLLVIACEAFLVFWPAHLSVKYALANLRDKSDALQKTNDELQRMSERLDYTTFHDQLTSLPNRRKLQAEIGRRLGNAVPGGLCVMSVDLDRFKEVNDAMGPEVGDGVLRHVARTLNSLVRRHDLVARVGADEFVMLLEFPRESAGNMARRFGAAALEAIKTPVEIDGHTCTINATVGYAFSAGRGDEPEALLGNASMALDVAKQTGRGKLLQFDSAMRAGMEWRRSLVGDMRLALERGEFVPYFQPKCNLNTGEIEGFEVLSRWQHPQRGLLQPSQFLDLAEEAGMLDVIDAQILHRGLDQLRDWRRQGEHFSLAFNATASSLRQTDWVADLGMALEMRGLTREDIVVEVLETILIQDSNDQAVKSIQALSNAGTRVDIDDFGTGYASMSMIATLDVGGLKIDRSLIVGLDDPKERQVVEAITGLAHGLGLKVTAEGVEHQAQIDILRQLNCETIQGFGVSRPMPLDEVSAWLKEWRNDMPSLHVG